MNERFVDKILSGPNLPSLPVVAMRVLELTQTSEVDLDELAREIQADQALTARIIRTINSSYYGLSRPCNSIRQAVGFLGLNAVKALVLGFGLVQSITGHDELDVGFDYLDYWRRAVYSAAAARLVAEETDAGDPEEAFLAALMQDIGMVAIYRATGDQYLQLIDMAQGDHRKLLEQERRLLEVSHPEIGAQIAERWKFPPTTVAAINCHHEADACKAKDRPFCRVVALSVDLAAAVLSPDDEETMKRYLHRCDEWFGMSTDQAKRLLGEAVEVAGELGAQLRLDTGQTPDIEPILARAEELRTWHSLEMSRRLDQMERAGAGNGRAA